MEKSDARGTYVVTETTSAGRYSDLVASPAISCPILVMGFYGGPHILAGASSRSLVSYIHRAIGSWYHDGGEQSDRSGDRRVSTSSRAIRACQMGFLHDHLQLAKVRKQSGKSWAVPRCRPWSLSSSIRFDIATDHGQVFTAPIICMQYNAPIEGTRHSHGLCPGGLVLEDTAEGIFRRIGTWNVMYCEVHEFLPYFDTKIISLV